MHSHLLLSIPLPSLSFSIEWLKLRSALTTIPVSQPLTSNPQPKPYRYSPVLNFSPVRPKSRYVSIQENRAFRKASYDDTNLTKSPEIRRFLALDFIFLTSRLPSQHALRRLNCSLFYSLVCENMSNVSSVCGNISMDYSFSIVCFWYS